MSHSFKPTGVREIDLILLAVSNYNKEKIQAEADNAARIWKILWVNEKY